MSASKRCAKSLESNIKIKLFNEIKAKFVEKVVGVARQENTLCSSFGLNFCSLPPFAVLLSSAKTFRVSYEKPNENKLIKIKLNTGGTTHT